MAQEHSAAKTTQVDITVLCKINGEKYYSRTISVSTPDRHHTQETVRAALDAAYVIEKYGHEYNAQITLASIPNP